MSNQTIARRYARALYEEAREAGRLDQVDADVLAVRESIEGAADLQRLLSSKVVARRRKEAVINSLFGDRVDDLIVGLMRLLISKGREDSLVEVVRSYVVLRDEVRGEVDANVRVAMPLSEQQQADLKSRLDAATGKSVRLNIAEDPSLISGLVVRVGDTVYDGSARHKLKTLREQFASRTFAPN